MFYACMHALGFHYLVYSACRVFSDLLSISYIVTLRATYSHGPVMEASKNCHFHVFPNYKETIRTPLHTLTLF